MSVSVSYDPAKVEQRMKALLKNRPTAVHIISRGKDKWAVWVTIHQKPRRVFDSLPEAIVFAVKLLSEKLPVLYVHDTTGRVTDEISYKG